VNESLSGPLLKESSFVIGADNQFMQVRASCDLEMPFDWM
jgi:hypothetical protein